MLYAVVGIGLLLGLVFIPITLKLGFLKSMSVFIALNVTIFMALGGLGSGTVAAVGGWFIMLGQAPFAACGLLFIAICSLVKIAKDD